MRFHAMNQSDMRVCVCDQRVRADTDTGQKIKEYAFR